MNINLPKIRSFHTDRVNIMNLKHLITQKLSNFQQGHTLKVFIRIRIIGFEGTVDCWESSQINVMKSFGFITLTRSVRMPLMFFLLVLYAKAPLCIIRIYQRFSVAPYPFKLYNHFSFTACLPNTCEISVFQMTAFQIG